MSAENPIVNLLRAGRIVGLDPREMMREALEQLRDEESARVGIEQEDSNQP